MKRSLCLLLWLPVAVFAAHAEKSAGSDDDRFLAARDAFRKGEAAKFEQAAHGVHDADLAPWVEYWSLRLQLDSDPADGGAVAGTVHDFLKRNNGGYLAEKLRGDWLRHLGHGGRWSEFAADYPPLLQADADIVCYGLQARLLGQQDASALDEARPLWFSLPEISDACLPLMNALATHGRLTVDDVWQRLRPQLAARRLPQARDTAAYLPAAERPETKRLDAIAEHPRRYLDKLPAHFADSRLGREMALFALVRLARQDPGLAASQLKGLGDRLPAADRGYVWGQIAWVGAQGHRPEALDWYAAAGTTPLSDEQLAWKARAILRSGDWAALARTIEAMPAPLAAQPGWIYWRGRALAALKRGEEAHALYDRIADLPTFYGNLAAEELGQTISPPPRAVPPTAEEMALASVNPGLRQALALFRVDMRVEGVREWNWAIRDMDDRQLLAAAELARRAGVYDRAINTAERTLAEHDFALRYPAPYRDQVGPKARELGLDDSWVYGLMRQESRFVTAAHSAVGAKGLMQLMPATARWVAKKIRLAGYHPTRVADMDTNVTLGTNYLKMVLDSLGDQPVLASAAYNAGPRRVRQWIGEVPVEGAIYIETIPFAETRDYVRKVMTNSVYYAALFEGKPQSLKRRLGVVSPTGSTDTLIEALP